MTIGDYIRNLRLTRSLTLKTVAARIEVDNAYLSRVESGKTMPSDSLLKRLADCLDASVEELLLLAGRLPPRWHQTISRNPSLAVEKIQKALSEGISEPRAPYHVSCAFTGGERAIEDGFPFERLASVAELESWRKEVNRPIYHLHKWWAQRLGSVFRTILIAACSPKGADVFNLFYQPIRLDGVVVFDPFMGSGTTIGEAHKMGARAIGKDINPVAAFIVRNALRKWSRRQILETFDALRSDVAETLRSFYRAKVDKSNSCDVLYYFWVKIVSCPCCGKSVDLFSSRIFSKHAYASRYPDAQSLCPHCGAIHKVRYDTARAHCPECNSHYNPQEGNVEGAYAHCPSCKERFAIAKTCKNAGHPPEHRMYAKMVLLPDVSKKYLAIDDFDRALYNRATKELKRRGPCYPVVPILEGYNTNQAINYGYTHWHQMFNDRQLLCLSILADRIRSIETSEIRELFACLFSGVLEFNNMFASFKGEGTGAVRHMFAHHILKPERTPLEANVWGTPKSSGAFSTLFESRLLRALDYQENPFELQPCPVNGKLEGKKIYGLSSPIGDDIAASYIEFERHKKSLYISCGNSAKTDLPDASVDLVVTDPPFFDNVHYSQLADFFYVWLRHILRTGEFDTLSTRSENEVQQTDPKAFRRNLAAVFVECRRVLKDEGLLIFTYHHSRQEGWGAVLGSILDAGFTISAAQPTKAEMSVAAPKQQAKQPIDIDIILICRKRPEAFKVKRWTDAKIKSAIASAQNQVKRFNAVRRQMSRNDVQAILMSQVICQLSTACVSERVDSTLQEISSRIEQTVEGIYSTQALTVQEKEEQPQLVLF